MIGPERQLSAGSPPWPPPESLEFIELIKYDAQLAHNGQNIRVFAPCGCQAFYMVVDVHSLGENEYLQPCEKPDCTFEWEPCRAAALAELGAF